eukprot:187446-Ditylum_brightwellii.AAC.1
MKITLSQPHAPSSHVALLVLAFLTSSGVLAQQERRQQNIRRRQQGATPIRQEQTGLDGGLPVDEYQGIKEQLDKQQLFQASNCGVYSMSFRNENYVTPEINISSQNWGRHALQWKGYLWE